MSPDRIPLSDRIGSLLLNRIGSDPSIRIGSDPLPRIGSEYPIPEPPEVFYTEVRAGILLEQLVRFGSDPNRLDLLLHMEFDLFSWHNRLLQLRIGLHLAKHDLVTTFPRSPLLLRSPPVTPRGPSEPEVPRASLQL